MTIREIEARCQMERANIRFYEREGLLTAQRLPNGYRDYTEEDVQTLLRIRLLRSLHVSLDDIRALTDGQKRAIARAAIAQGITRIGWGRTFIHLDVDGTKPQRVAWGYPGSPAPAYTSLA